MSLWRYLRESRRAVGTLALLAFIVAGPAGSTPAEIPAAASAVVAPSWQWPVDEPRSIARPYIAPTTPYAAGHRGIDIRAPFSAVGASVYAPADGVVHFAGVVVDRPVLSIRHAGGLISSFEPVTTTLVAGTAVRRGEVVGALAPDHCAAPCLHFGVRRDGEYVSPLNYLGGIPHSVLLPTRAPG